MAVKSTGIYCIASCPARFPDVVNIEFYGSRDAAEDAGYRGCYRCHASTLQFSPEWVNQVVTYLHNHIDKKVVMGDLERITGKHRSTISSYFHDIHGTTPRSYHRQLKLDAAWHRISAGQDYRDVAFALGYQSISGFRSAFKKYHDHTPGQLYQEVV